MALIDKQYKLTRTGSGVTDELGRSIPADPENRDWQEYQKWLLLPGKVSTSADPKSPFEPSELEIWKQALTTKGTINPAELSAARTKLINDHIPNP